jgi:hypothetical protein
MLIYMRISATSHFMQSKKYGFDRELLCFMLENRCLAKRREWPKPDSAAPEYVLL